MQAQEEVYGNMTQQFEDGKIKISGFINSMQTCYNNKLKPK
jgi:hypothetical protein